MSLFLSETFRDRLAAAPRPLAGGWVCSGSPLVAEIMGRLSNLLLLDERDFILECSRHVTTRVNRVRESLPGEAYAAVPDFGKLDPTTATAAALAARWPAEPALLTVWVRQTLQGASDVLLAVLLSFIGAAAGSIGKGPALGIAVPVVLGSVAINLLEIFVAFLHAFIFTFLTTLFIGQAVLVHQEEHGGHGSAA